MTRRAALDDATTLTGAHVADRLRSALPTLGQVSDSGVITTLPEAVQQHIADHVETLTRLERLWADHAEVLREARLSHTAVLRHAILLHQGEERARAVADEREQLILRASGAGRTLTAGETRRLTDTHLDAFDAHAALESLPTGVPRDEVARMLARLRVRDAARELRGGLLLTRQMRDIRSEALPALRRGDPQLLIGETGGAKTALAEYLARYLVPGDPEFVSGYGDITSAQVIGTHELRAVDGATFTEFVPGPLLRAMIEGSPVILDEINAMPPEFLKRLNRVLQLRPGDVLRVQENAGAQVRIAPGFVMIATANEQSGRRYRGIEPLSAELLNRFGANTFRVRYPDSTREFAETPRENLLLAVAAASLPDGRLPHHLSGEALERIARAAFISQRVFSGHAGEGFTDYVSTEHTIDGRPGLEESVLAPRTLVSLVEKVARSAGTVSLDHAVQRFIEGVMHQEDRQVLTLILRGQGFEVEPV